MRGESMMTTPHIHRARIYKLLAVGFDKPLDRAADGTDGPPRSAIGTELHESATAIDPTLASAAAAVAESWPRSVEHHRSLYRSTFGVEHESAISRYEVSFAPGTLVTNTDRMADIAGFYRAFGLDIAENAQERVDFLPTQLEFMQHLALQCAYLVETDDQEGVEIVRSASASFIEDHLGRWVPRFVEEIVEEVDGTVYAELATVLGRWVEREGDRVGVEPDVFDDEPPAPLEGITGLERDEFGRLSVQCGFDRTSSGVSQE